MRHAIFFPLVVLGAALPAGVAFAADFPAGAIDKSVSTAPIIQAVFGDAPPTGAHRGKHRHGAEPPKDTGPSKIDMHGATREGADDIYRKKYGF